MHDYLPFLSKFLAACASFSVCSEISVLVGIFFTGVERFESSPEYTSKSESEGVSVYVSASLLFIDSQKESELEGF